MTDLLAAVGVGFVLGLRHATDADHVVAVTAIVAEERTLGRAARIGALWGVGHSLTLLLVGGALVALRVTVPPRVGLGLELGVALMLIALGFRALRPGRTSGGPPRRAAVGPGRPLLVGTVHGLAGSAAVALLVLAGIRSTAWAFAYLALFGIGTVAGMVIVTTVVAAPALYAGARLAHVRRGVHLAAGALSVAFGLLLANTIISDGGIFTATPVWEPR
jgi:high-affinity nickel-transport protein